MPRVKRTTTEEQVIEQPQVESPPTYADKDLFDRLDSLQDTDFVEGSHVKLAYYIYQDQPAVTKKEGESAYAKIFSQRFTADDLRAINPQATRWKIIEKVMGDRTRRDTYYVAMMPQQTTQGGPTPATVGMGAVQSDMATTLKTVVDLASDRTGVQRQAMTQSIDIMGEAYKTGLEMMKPQSGSLAKQLTELKEAGLLATGNTGGMDLEKIQKLIEWGIPLLRNSGILPAITAAKDPKKELESTLEFLDAIQERFGKASKGEPSLWPIVVQTFGPSVVRMLDNMTSNVADIFRAKAAMAGITVQPSPKVAEAGTEAAAATPAAQPPAPEDQAPSAQDYVKLCFVRLCQDELKEEKPDAENIANWLEMTAPQLAELLAKTPEPGVMQFLDVDAILKYIGSDEKAMTFKKAVYAELVKDAAQQVAQ